MRSDGVGGLFRGLSSLIGRDVPFNALFYGSYESCCAALMRAEGLKSKDDLGMSRIFFAGGLRGWLQTVPAPGVAAAGPSPTTHRSTRLGAQPRPLRFRSRSHANKPASERPRPETSHLPPNRPRRQLRLVAHHAVRPHCEQANRADLAVHRCRFGTLWLWVAIRTRGRGLAPT